MKLKRAVKLIEAGHGRRLDKFCSPWSIQMVALFSDVALEGGGLLPWRRGCLEDQPYKELLALRLIRAEWSRRNAARLDKARSRSR